MIQGPTKAIIAVAGFGTRRLPVAKAVEKCMLPLLNRPVVDYVVEDVVKAGVTDIYFVVSGDARQLRDYYSRDVELEEYLARKGKNDLIDLIKPPAGVSFHYIEQDRNDSRYGTTVPVWLCRDYINADEQFLMMGGDQTLWRSDGASESRLLIEQVLHAGVDAGLIGVEVPIEQIERYGAVSLDQDGYYTGIVEHPKPSEAPSNLNNANFFLMPGTFMGYVNKQMKTRREGEYYLTDVVNDFVAADNKLSVRKSDAAYLDCGTVEGWVAANAYLMEAQAPKG
jgi:UTP--glucose-1-phosphate uridylyltransferase